MANRKKRLERRKYKRFRVPKNAFVLFRPHDTEVGQIIDISADGLAFDYVGAEVASNESSEFDILLTDSDFHMYNIPFKNISDFETYKSPSGSISKRRGGVQFGGLSQEQISQLQHFIQNYTVGEV